MNQVNPVLKRLFITFNIFFGTVGGVIVMLAMLSHIVSGLYGVDGIGGLTTGVVLLYVFGSLTMLVAILGAYGARGENKGALIVFLVSMVFGSLVMLRIGIPAAMTRPQLEDKLEERFRRVLPLDQASPGISVKVDILQMGLHCCGLFSSDDWEQDIPRSCFCNQEEQEEGMCQSLTCKAVMRQEFVYTQTCFPIILRHTLLCADILLGVVLTLAMLALLGLALSSLVIHQLHQLRPHAQPTVLLSAIFSPAPPKYQKLHNSPVY